MTDLKLYKKDKSFKRRSSSMENGNRQRLSSLDQVSFDRLKSIATWRDTDLKPPLLNVGSVVEWVESSLVATTVVL